MELFLSVAQTACCRAVTPGVKYFYPLLQSSLKPVLFQYNFVCLFVFSASKSPACGKSTLGFQSFPVFVLVWSKWWRRECSDVRISEFQLSILKFKFLSVVFKKHLVNPAPAEDSRQMALWNRQKQQKVQHNTFLYIWSQTLGIVFMCVFVYLVVLLCMFSVNIEMIWMRFWLKLLWKLTSMNFPSLQH